MPRHDIVAIRSAVGPYAWVIDGTTDVLEAPLTPGVPDASWVAATLHRLLGEAARAPATV